LESRKAIQDKLGDEGVREAQTSTRASGARPWSRSTPPTAARSSTRSPPPGARTRAAGPARRPAPSRSPRTTSLNTRAPARGRGGGGQS